MDQKNPELVIEEWLKRAEEDMKSAKAMLDTNHYTWCAFICQQALEKW
ncbi:MAG: HEPN domain-containing protein [bacterium]|nr:HEPN domain-containing protein [bacterium]